MREGQLGVVDTCHADSVNTVSSMEPGRFRTCPAIRSVQAPNLKGLRTQNLKETCNIDNGLHSQVPIISTTSSTRTVRINYLLRIQHQRRFYEAPYEASYAFDGLAILRFAILCNSTTFFLMGLLRTVQRQQAQQQRPHPPAQQTPKPHP